MGKGEIGERPRIGLVKAAANMFGERINEGGPSLKKTHMDFLLEEPPGARELHMAERDIVKFKNRRRAADSERVQAESELFDVRKTVKNLSLQIEESNSEAKSRREESNVQSLQYVDVMRELEFVKQELSKLKLGKASVLEAKLQADRQMKGSILKIDTYLDSEKALRKEIDEVNEQHVLVELARIEALKEYGAIEAYREDDFKQYSSELEKTRMKVKEIIEEIDRSKELETQLAVTESEIDVLQCALKQVKEMDRGLQHTEGSSQTENPEALSLMQSVTEELEAAKKELASVREEGFQFMSCIETISNELKHVMEETVRMERNEEKTELTVQNLNSKLLREITKLETLVASEEKAKLIFSNLNLALEQLKVETEAAKNENEIISEETAKIKKEVQKTEAESDLIEEKLQAALQELEAVKKSEALALDDLKIIVMNTVETRASAAQRGSSIIISQFEYEYLTGRAAEAEEVADRKVAAAQAWIQAIKSSEKEILMKTEVANREMKEIQKDQEEIYSTHKSLPANRMTEEESQNWLAESQRCIEAERMKRTMSRKYMKDSGTLTPARRTRLRKAGSPALGSLSRSATTSVKKKRK